MTSTFQQGFGEWQDAWQTLLLALHNASGPALIGFALLVGAASSFTHCAGMCAPIHLFLAARRGGQVYAYHAGRITTYVALGVLAGLLGQGLALPSSTILTRVTASVLALAYILMALHWLGWLRLANRMEAWLGHWLGKPAAKALPALAQSTQPSPWPVYVAGLAGGLLPCPTTQALLLVGLGLGKPLQASAAMLALGLGTLPVFAVLRPKLARGPRRHALAFARVLGLIFIGLAIVKVHGAWFTSHPSCH